MGIPSLCRGSRTNFLLIASAIGMLISLSFSRVAAFRGRAFKGRTYSKSSLQMMPEGPEVRSLVDYLDHSFCTTDRHHLMNASIISGRYTVKKPTGWETLNVKIKDKKNQPLLTAVKSKGKFIYFDFGDFYLWSTLGMTGGWTTSPHRRHIRFALNFRPVSAPHSAVTLFYYDQRNFGTLKVSESREELDRKLASLGANWLDNDAPTVEKWIELAEKAGKRKRPLCVFLMDQSKTSGIGNYVLSECLYRARIHPFACTSVIDEQGWTDLHTAISAVLEESYAAQRPVIDETSNTMSKNRRKRYNNSVFTFRIYSRSVTPDGNPVTKTLGTHKRSIFFDPLTQTLYKPPNFELESKESRSAGRKEE